MTTDELKDRALSEMAGEPIQFDPITIAILMAVVSWLVTRCLNRLNSQAVRNPGMIRKWQLRNLVRKCCTAPVVQQAAVARGMPQDASAIDAAYGDRIHAALLAAGQRLSDDEIRSAFGG